MPGRKIPLITSQIYHVFNRGINRQPTFTSLREYKRAVLCLEFYRLEQSYRLSKYLLLKTEKQKEILSEMSRKPRVKVLAYCVMPNHFHLLVQQVQESGISKFLANVQNSYTRYFNTLHKRDGALFLDQFKAVRIETDEQLLHVHRYIHLNPYTGYIVKSLEDLYTYPWSSLEDYVTTRKSFIDAEPIKSFLDEKKYKTFLEDQADYQRELSLIKYLVFE